MCCTRRVAHFACRLLLVANKVNKWVFYRRSNVPWNNIGCSVRRSLYNSPFWKVVKLHYYSPKEQLYSFRQTDQPNENYQIGLVCTGSLKLQEGAKRGHVEIIFRERNNKQYGTVTLNINITNSQRTHNAQRSSQHIVSLSKDPSSSSRWTPALQLT